MANILVVDDEAPIRDLMARVLTLDGHAVETASDGAEALETLTAREGGFDLMLTDIRMPLMDGIALALAAKRDYPGLTILMMTGYAEQRERARSLEAIVTDVLVKPFSLAQARASVAAALKIAA
jgi:CheY-like chemotaxis protein